MSRRGTSLFEKLWHAAGVAYAALAMAGRTNLNART